MAPAAAELPASAARELVTRLGRAVQRATIYPHGHPSIRLATLPLVETLRGISAPQVLVGFTSEQVFVGVDPRDARPFDFPWLSARLSARGLSSVRIDPRLATEEAERLVEWLAAGDDLLTADAVLPVFDGAVAARMDFAAVRFQSVTQPQDAPTAPADLAWLAVARVLTGQGAEDATAEAWAEPAEVARLIRDAIDRQEGTGVRELEERLLAAGRKIADLPDELRSVLKARLASFVAALSPGLRRRVLAVAPGVDPARLALLGDIVDRLPSTLVVEVIRGTPLGPDIRSREFLAFVLKLAGLASRDPELAYEFERSCLDAGLPPDLAYFEAPRLREVLQDLVESGSPELQPAGPAPCVRLPVLAAAATTPAWRTCIGDAQIAPDDAAGLTLQNARITLHLLQGPAMAVEEQVTCLDRLAQALPACVAAWQPGLLAAASELSARLGQAGLVDAEVRARAARMAAWFEEPAMVQALLARLEEADAAPSPEVLSLARAAGRRLAAAVLDAAVRAGGGPERARLARVLGWLEPLVVRRTVAEAYEQSPRHARTLLSVLESCGEGAPVADAALPLLADGDPSLRLETFRFLFSTPLSTARMAALIARALEDADARVLRLGIDEAGRLPRAGARPLSAWLTQRLGPEVATLQAHAAHVLAAMGIPEAFDGLRAALVARQSRFDATSRATAFAIAEALGEGDQGASDAVVRAWRRSPAGWLARLTGEGRRS